MYIHSRILPLQPLQPLAIQPPPTIARPSSAGTTPKLLSLKPLRWNEFLSAVLISHECDTVVGSILADFLEFSGLVHRRSFNSICTDATPEDPSQFADTFGSSSPGRRLSTRERNL